MLRRTRRSSAEGRGSPKVETAKVAWRLRATEGRSLTLSEGTRAEGLWLRSFLPRLLCHHGPWQKGMHKLKFQRTALWNQDATFVGKLATGRKKSRITLLYYRLCCFSFIRPLSCYFKKWDMTIVSLPFTFRNARVDWFLSKQQVESTTHIHWEWQELEDATSWGHVWRPWPRGARWASVRKCPLRRSFFLRRSFILSTLTLPF